MLPEFEIGGLAAEDEAQWNDGDEISTKRWQCLSLFQPNGGKKKKNGVNGRRTDGLHDGLSLYVPFLCDEMRRDETTVIEDGYGRKTVNVRVSRTALCE